MTLVDAMELVAEMLADRGCSATFIVRCADDAGVDAIHHELGVPVGSERRCKAPREVHRDGHAWRSADTVVAGAAVMIDGPHRQFGKEAA